MNLPFDIIHDPLNSYGFLLLPTWKRDSRGERRWLAFFPEWGPFCLTDIDGFHNCRETEVY
jgi:hypothetical protein